SARACGSELVSVTVVDEVDCEDRLEDVARWHLTLLQASAVSSKALFTGNVSLRDGTTHDSEHGIRPLGGQALRDELIEPASGGGVVLEIFGLQQFDEVLYSRLEVATNAKFFESDDHVFARRRTVFTVGENVTRL